MRYLTAKRLITHEKKKKENRVSLFAGFWLMTGWNAMNAPRAKAHLGGSKREQCETKSEKKMKNLILKSICGTAMALLLVGGAQMLGFGQSSEKQDPTLEGAWRTTLTIRNCQTGAPIRTFQGLQTFNKGGTLTETGTIPAPSLRTPGHGVWKREQGWQEYSFAFMYDLFNADGTLAGSRTVRGAVTLGASGNEFTVVASSETVDANGQLTATGCSAATATRFE